jgi:putative SOS response-associated peptidase YedK
VNITNIHQTVVPVPDLFWSDRHSYVVDDVLAFPPSIRAKGETLLDSNVWKDSFLRRRCLIPVDSFIEWRAEDKTKLPWVFAMHDDEPFAFGGVWRHWRSPDGKTQMDTFAVITTEPNELLVEKTGHDRMPVIIGRQAYRRWLEPGTTEQPPIDLLRPFDSEKMKAWRVDQRLNNVRNNDALLNEPLKDESEGRLLGMFG